MSFRYWPQIIVFIMAYGLEVQVKAALNQEVWLSEPQGCHLVSGQNMDAQSCLLRATSAKVPNALIWRRAQISVAKDSVILLQGQSLRLLEGQLLLESPGMAAEGSAEDVDAPRAFLVISSEYGQMQVSPGTWILLRRDADHWVDLEVLRGQVKLDLLGHRESLVLEQGFALNFGPVNENGLVQVELPQPISFKSALARWSHLDANDPESWRTKVQSVILDWQRAAQQIAGWQSQSVMRHLASVQEEKQKQEQRLQQRQREDEELRKLFRQKNYLE